MSKQQRLNRLSVFLNGVIDSSSTNLHSTKNMTMVMMQKKTEIQQPMMEIHLRASTLPVS